MKTIEFGPWEPIRQIQGIEYDKDGIGSIKRMRFVDASNKICHVYDPYKSKFSKKYRGTTKYREVALF